MGGRIPDHSANPFALWGTVLGGASSVSVVETSAEPRSAAPAGEHIKKTVVAKAVAYRLICCIECPQNVLPILAGLVCISVNEPGSRGKIAKQSKLVSEGQVGGAV